MSPIYLAPHGAVDNEILSVIEVRLRRVFGFETCRLSPRPDLVSAYDPGRQQYSSVVIMRELLKNCPNDAVRVLAVTEKDLFIPMLSFIYGQAQLDGTVAILSLARLRQEFYGLRPNPMLLLKRTVKEACHEVGHTFGLIHCLKRTCPMSLSTNILQLDAKGVDFCDDCADLLRENIAALNQGKVASAEVQENR